MRLRFILPIAYVIVSVVLVLGFGGVGHGKGIEIFYYISLPLGAMSKHVEKSFQSGEWALISCFLAGVIQYSLAGYLLDRWLVREK